MAASPGINPSKPPQDGSVWARAKSHSRRPFLSGWGILARGGLGGRLTREFPFDRRWEGHFS